MRILVICLILIFNLNLFPCQRSKDNITNKDLLLLESDDWNKRSYIFCNNLFSETGNNSFLDNKNLISFKLRKSTIFDQYLNNVHFFHLNDWIINQIYFDFNSDEKTNLLSVDNVSVDSLKKYNYRKWQFKFGYSPNNKNIFNIEISNILRLSNFFALSLDCRLYSFISLSPCLITRQFYVNKYFSFSLKGGIGLTGLPVPATYGTDITTELGVLFKYKINEKYNIILEYKRINKNSLYEGFYSLFFGPPINNFPIQFISTGIEL